MLVSIQEAMDEKAKRLLNFLVALAVWEVAALTLTEVVLAETYTAESGDVQAELSYLCEAPGEYGGCLKNLSTLKILRQGKVILDVIVDESVRPTVTYDLVGGFKVRDLDGDREPEIIVDIYTGGAHCCTVSLIYRYDPEQNQYLQTERNWQHSSYQLEDLDQDENPEFLSGDDRFAYQFASYAGSGRPIQIWQYRQGKFVDVTRQYPQKIYQNAHEHWQNYQAAKSQGNETKGMLAGYLAAKYLLGQGEDGWQRVKQAYRRGDRQVFFKRLEQFLQATGYISQ